MHVDLLADVFNGGLVAGTCGVLDELEAGFRPIIADGNVIPNAAKRNGLRGASELCLGENSITLVVGFASVVAAHQSEVHFVLVEN